MNLRVFVSLIVICGSSLSAAQVHPSEAVFHILGPGSSTKTPVTTGKMWERIRDAAAKYREYAPVPRAAFYDITFPATADEYRALDGYGLLLITVVTQDATEIPLPQVILRGRQQSHSFQLMSSFRSPVEDPLVRIVLGRTRFDALYLFPMHLRQESAELIVDFAANRTGFVLGKFPLQPHHEGLPMDPPSARNPPEPALSELLKRELPMFLEVRETQQ